MIKSIHLTNIQSHKDSLLEFHEGVNVIVGQSDSGKTAILRGLKMVKDNRPLGDEVIRRGQKDASVTLVLHGGMKITRRKGSVNSYELDGEEMKAFGQSVPNEVASTLNMQELNMTLSQFDAPFLISESPGEVAKRLNEISNISKIDTASAHVNSQIRTLSSEIEVKEADLSIMDEKLKLMPDMDDLGQHLQSLEELGEEIRLGREKGNRLLDLLEDLDSIAKEEKRSKDLFKSLPELKSKLDSLHELASAVSRGGERLKALESAVKSIWEIESALGSLKTGRENLETTLGLIMPKSCPLCGQALKGVL